MRSEERTQYEEEERLAKDTHRSKRTRIVDDVENEWENEEEEEELEEEEIVVRRNTAKPIQRDEFIRDILRFVGEGKEEGFTCNICSKQYDTPCVNSNV
jgi:hypothetical protein